MLDDQPLGELADAESAARCGDPWRLRRLRARCRHALGRRRLLRPPERARIELVLGDELFGFLEGGGCLAGRAAVADRLLQQGLDAPPDQRQLPLRIRHVPSPAGPMPEGPCCREGEASRAGPGEIIPSGLLHPSRSPTPP